MIKFKNIKISRKKAIILVGIFLLAIIAIFSITKNYLNCSDVKVNCSRVGDMLIPRESHFAVILNDGKVLIVGGNSSDGNDFKREQEVEIFDPKTKQFNSGGTTHYPHYGYEMPIKTEEGKVIFIDGYYGIEIFNPKQNKFIKSKTSPLKRYLSTCYMGNNKVLLIAGSNTSIKENKYNNSDLYMYDVNSDKLLKIGIIDDILNEPYSLKINDNKILLLGKYKIIRQNNEYITEWNSGVYSINLKDFKTTKLGNLALSEIKDVFKINKNEILIVNYDSKLEIYNTQTNKSFFLENIEIKNIKREWLFFPYTVSNSFYQIDNYNYLIMQDGKISYLLNIKDKTLKKICGLEIDVEYPIITFLNHNQILLTGGQIDYFMSSLPVSQNKAYICTINYSK